VVFHALTERQGMLHDLVVNSNNVFSATASEQNALARTFDILPTFEDESKATLADLQGFSKNADPVVNDLKPVADRLAPTVKDLNGLAPNLQTLFQQKLPPLISAAQPNLPNGARFLRGASPVMDGLHSFLPELNPILSFTNFDQAVLANFLSAGGSATRYQIDPPINGVPLDALSQFGLINQRSLGMQTTVPSYDRGNAYLAPNAYTRAAKTGVIESLSCANAGGEQKNPDPNNSAPPCFVQPPSLFNGQDFPLLQKGVAPVKPAPGTYDGTKPAQP